MTVTGSERLKCSRMARSSLVTLAVFRRRSSPAIAVSSDRIYFNESEKLFQYSGRVRVRVPPAEIPLVFERSSMIDSGWSPLQTIPANTAYDYLDSNFPGAGNTFYRTRPAL